MVNLQLSQCMLMALIGLLQNQWTLSEPISYNDLKPQGDSAPHDLAQAAKLRIFYKERLQVKKGHHTTLEPISTHPSRGTTPRDHPDKPSAKVPEESRMEGEPHGKELHPHLDDKDKNYSHHEHGKHEREPALLSLGERQRDAKVSEDEWERHRDYHEGNARPHGDRLDKDIDRERSHAERRDEGEGHNIHNLHDREDPAKKVEG